MLNHNCPICSSKLKIIPDEYHLLTKLPHKRMIVLENIFYERCSICDFEFLTDESSIVVDTMKDFYEREYERHQEKEANERTNFVLRFRRG